MNEVDHDNPPAVSLIENEVSALTKVEKAFGIGPPLQEDVTRPSMWRMALRESPTSLDQRVSIVFSLIFAEVSDRPFEYRSQRPNSAWREPKVAHFLMFAKAVSKA